MRPLRVGVDARIVPGSSGGVETLVMGLAAGFASAHRSDVLPVFVTYAGYSDWIRPFLSDSLEAIAVRAPGKSDRIKRKARVWAIRPSGRSFGIAPSRDHTMAVTDTEVVHFPLQFPGWVPQPFIYHPHDLQHRHLPEFFSPRQIAARDVVYERLCRRAAAVAVGSTWAKEDLIKQLQVDAAKVFVVPLAPLSVTHAHHQGSLDLSKLQLPDRYITYPAVPWPHKNHVRLFQALAALRTRGIDVPLVLTGARLAESVDLAGLARRLQVSDLVSDLGYITQEEVEAVIARSMGLVVPTLFEAASFPIWEAFRLGVPVACSDVTSLPQQVGDAAIVFDPRSAEAMADAIEALWTDEQRCEQLVRLARSRVSCFSWEKTAAHFAALYKCVAGRPLSDDDRAILLGKPAL